MYLCSNSIMALIDNIIGSLNIANKNMPILNFNTKLSFQSLMNLNRSLNV